MANKINTDCELWVYYFALLWNRKQFNNEYFNSVCAVWFDGNFIARSGAGVSEGCYPIKG